MDSKPVMDLSGWEAFVHGVFAIAVTLLVLDIHVPDADEIDSGSALLGALVHEAPHYTAYVLGFLCLGTYWMNVHKGLRMLRGIDHGFIVIGLAFLLVVAAVPFVTALLAEYIGKGNGQDQVALVVFTACQLVLALIAHASVRYTAHRRLTRPGVPLTSVRAWVRISALGPVIWLIALATALLANGTITLVLIAVVFGLFMIEVPVREQAEEAVS
jgi:uncharacterized membrane protein